MNTKQFLFFLTFIFSIVSCSEDSDIIVSRNLQQYIEENANVEYEAVIACAANADANTELAYIFYYPEEGATDVRYYELTDSTLVKTEFVNYRRKSLDSETVFGGKLERFSRAGSVENWCLITYKKEGILRVSEPIKLNNTSKSTTYLEEVSINYTTTIEPNFTWQDETLDDNTTYFQVISDEEDKFISGTYTENTFFQYYDTANVTLNINTTTPKMLVEDEVYNFTMMGIDKDNWVNLIIEEQFIPRNLEEYIATKTAIVEDAILAFAGNANGNENETYIYFQPVEGAFDYRYYETKDTLAIQTNYANYKRKSLTDITQFNNTFRRFTNASSDEVWCLVTYIVDGKLYISEPIQTKNKLKETEWTTEIEPTYPETLKPLFTWEDGKHNDNAVYLQVFTKSDDTLLSGTFTTEKKFQYYNESNVIKENNIHTETPPVLILDDEYKFTLFGISSDNWVNLVIQYTFIVE